MSAFWAVEAVDGRMYFIYSDSEADDSCIDSISITLSDGIRYFYSKLDQENIKEMAEQSKLDYPTYCEQLLAAIAGIKSDEVTEYFYQLTWKRALTKTTSYHLGTVQLKSLTGADHVKAAVDMLKFCSDEITSMKSKLYKTEQAYKQMVNDRDGAINDYREAVEAKIRSEEQLMQKFANILNEKKKRIEELEKEGFQHSSDSERESPVPAAADDNRPQRGRRLKRGGQRSRAQKKSALA